MTARPIAVLLVTQDPAFTATSRLMFGEHPGFVLTIGTVPEAVPSFRAAPPDLVLIDADSTPDPAAAVSLLTLIGTAPVVVAGAALPAVSGGQAALRALGASAVLFKPGGSSGIGLLRDRDGTLARLREIIEDGGQT